eukprot:1804410-Pleurochrysis_carterae.AAC.1
MFELSAHSSSCLRCRQQSHPKICVAYVRHDSDSHHDPHAHAKHQRTKRNRIRNTHASDNSSLHFLQSTLFLHFGDWGARTPDALTAARADRPSPLQIQTHAITETSPRIPPIPLEFLHNTPPPLLRHCSLHNTPLPLLRRWSLHITPPPFAPPLVPPFTTARARACASALSAAARSRRRAAFELRGAGSPFTISNQPFVAAACRVSHAAAAHASLSCTTHSDSTALSVPPSERDSLDQPAAAVAAAEKEAAVVVVALVVALAVVVALASVAVTVASVAVVLALLEAVPATGLSRKRPV